MPPTTETHRRPSPETAAPGFVSRRIRAATIAGVLWVRPAALVVLLASTVALVAGEDRDPGAVIPKVGIRREILSPYKFVPHPAESSSPAPFLAREPSSTGDQRLATPAASDFREPRVMSRLDAAILREQADAREARVASRLGIGVSSVRLGRHLVLGAATAFYIPVAVGLGVAW